MSKITKKWRRKAKIYKLFAESEWNNLDFSEKAAQEMFDFESRGEGNIEIRGFSTNTNGYAVGKKWLNVTVSSWIEDIKSGLLTKFELYQDPEFSNYHWWLDEVLQGIHPNPGLPGIWKYYNKDEQRRI